MFGTPFEIFGTVHLITIASIIIVSVFLPKIYKSKSNDQKAMMKKIIAAVIADPVSYTHLRAHETSLHQI